MKKLLLFSFIAITLLFAGHKSAQAQLDLSDTLIYPTATTPIYENVGFTAFLRILNPGATYPADSTITVNLQLNGNTVATFGPVNFTADFQTGAQSTIIQINVPASALAGLGGQTATLCAVIDADGDTNPANDQSCQTLNIGAAATIDFGVTALSVYVDGNELTAGGTIEIGKTIDSAKVEITNFTSNAFSIGYALSYTFNIADSSVTFNVATGGFTANGTTTRTITNPIAFDGLPTTAGNYEICASVLAPNDSDPTNNSNCGTASEFTFEPPLSVTFLNNENQKPTLFMSGQDLIVQQTNFDFQNIEVINALGQSVKTSSLNNQSLVNLSSLPSGVYIVKLTGSKQQVYSEKIIKK